VKHFPQWAWLILVAAPLRLLNLGGPRFWYDEAFTAWVTKPGTDLWAAIVGDTHPPLWSLLQAANARLVGLSEFTFRLPAALLGVASVLLVWGIARKLTDARTAFLAGLLAAVLPGAIFVSQDARMYAALIFCVLMALYAALRQNWYLFALAGIGAVYTQNIGLFYIGLLGLIVLVQAPDNDELAKRLVSQAVIGLAWMPWADTSVRQSMAVGAAFWKTPLSIGQLVEPFASYTLGVRTLPAYWAVFVIAFAMTLVGLITARGMLRTKASALFLTVCLGVPALLAVVSLLWKNIYVYRALEPSFVLLVIPWACALTHLAPERRRWAWALLTPALAIALVSHYVQGNSDVVAWLEPIRQDWQPSDIVYHTARTTEIGYGIYTPDLPYAVRPLRGDVVQVTDACALAFGLNEVAFEDLAMQGYRRAWLVVNWSPYTTAEEESAIRSILAKHPSRLVQHTLENPLIVDELYLVELR